MFKATSVATTLSVAALVALGPLSTDMYLPTLPGLARELDTTPAKVQLTLSLFLVGFAIAQIVYGPLSDRFGRKPVLLSGLVLAGSNHRNGDPSSLGPEDGILTAQEIAALDLSGAAWVVLSACDTGLGSVVAREGVLGLRRAFQVAGASTLILSLWRVDDDSTREWMSQLYTARLAGATTPGAMRRASRRVVRRLRERDLPDHPFFWGAFIALGDWR